MSHWNHRVVKRVYEKGTEREETMYQIHEAFYGLEGSTKPSITTNPVDVVGESVEGLRETLTRMLKCLDKPVLDYDTREEIE